MKIKESKANDNILWVFVIVGGLIMLVGVAVAIYFGIDSKNYVALDATVTDIETYRDSDGESHSRFIVSYEYEGVLYENIRTNFWTTGVGIGDTVSVQVNRENPTELESTTIQIILPCVLFGFGMLFFLIALFPLLKSIKSRKGSKTAQKNGQAIECRITRVLPDTSYRVNGRIVNNLIECEPINSIYTATYTSAPFNRKYPVAVGSKITVYQDPNDPKHYHVDLNSIVPPDPTETAPAPQTDIPTITDSST